MAGDSDKVATDTAIWLARLERGLTAQEGSQLREWLQRPAHREAIVEAAKVWHGADIVAVLAELVPVGFGTPRPPRRRIQHPIALAVGICLVVAYLVVPAILARRAMSGRFTAHENRQVDSVPWGETVYRTKPGETRAVTLADGRRLTLNAHTQVGVIFGAGLRQARVDYGEAIFQIAPEPLRTFEVNAGGRHIMAPPSMFDIRVIDAHGVELMVLDGGVTVQGLPWHWPDTPAEARMFDPAVFVDTQVGPQQALLMQDQTVSRYPLTAANIHTRLKWQPEEVIYVTP